MCKISIIIPVYGVEKYLPSCLDSIFSQITDGCEVILVDDGSKDNSGKICDEYKEKYPEITKVIHQQNCGQGGARNRGISEAAGEYLFFIDGDDTLLVGALEKLLAAAECGADIIFFPWVNVSENGEAQKCSPLMLTVGKTVETENEKGAMTVMPCPWNRITKKSLYCDNNIEFPCHVWYEDIRTTVKTVGLSKNYMCLDTPLYAYLRRSGSVMNNKNTERNREITDALDELLVFFTEKGIYENYREELEFLIIDHIFISATVRVLRNASAKNPQIKLFRDYTYAHCKKGLKNKYVKAMPRNRRIIMKLLKMRLYGAVMFIFRYVKK